MENINALDKITGKLNDWWELFIENLPNLGIAILVLVISYFVSKLVYNIALKVASRKGSQDSVTKLIARSFSVIVVLLGLFLALGALNLGKTLTALISAAGVSGLVIGLALQGTLSNTFSGIVLSFRKNIRIGDWVETNGFSGEVMDINLNYFVLKEADNNLVIIPNKTIINNPIKNQTLTTKMRVMIECGVGYESDLPKVEKIVRETICNAFEHISSPEDVEFFYTEFGGSSINFLCRFWIDSERSLERLVAQSKGVIEIKKAFDREGINIPFPIRTLQFENTLKTKDIVKEEMYSNN
ncbi:mechanosensitive ion channel family protein [Aureisphaera sp. CAU 1614]|uniref:Mechanosensitive ion channel family protein n=1 Tax=Halomarinibacterium sedimenti TaxID=2857106 RepID=A0A9X1JWA1_9FLAO|nr:mechanosensitive ion channel family protein [Halomarinibacterium sedimenti]MBW2938615.1 mechanosensitive ion channel family protein [Halomarinibacterium sedimenti]